MKTPPVLVRPPPIQAAVVARQRRGLSAWHVLGGAAVALLAGCCYLAWEIGRLPAPVSTPIPVVEDSWHPPVRLADYRLAESVAGVIDVALNQGDAVPNFPVFFDQPGDWQPFTFSVWSTRQHVFELGDESPTRKKWVLKVCVTLGDMMTQHPDLKVKELRLGDRVMGEHSTNYLVVNAAALPGLETKASRHEITLDEMYSEVLLTNSAPR